MKTSALIRGLLISTSQINFWSVFIEKWRSHYIGWKYKKTRLKKLKQSDVTYMTYIKKKTTTKYTM